MKVLNTILFNLKYTKNPKWLDLGSSVILQRGGSSPPIRTNYFKNTEQIQCLKQNHDKTTTKSKEAPPRALPLFIPYFSPAYILSTGRQRTSRTDHRP